MSATYVTHDEMVTFLRLFKKITAITNRELEQRTGVNHSTIYRVLSENQTMDMRSYEKFLGYFETLGYKTFRPNTEGA